jgi:hypothetical protein
MRLLNEFWSCCLLICPSCEVDEDEVDWVVEVDMATGVGR